MIFSYIIFVVNYQLNMSLVLDMYCESERLKTFEMQSIGYINSKDLVAADFHYYPIDTRRLKSSLILRSTCD